MFTLARHLFPLAKPRIVLLLVFTAAAGGLEGRGCST